MRSFPFVMMLYLSISSPLEAKCAFHQYTFTGTIVEDSARTPVAGARVLLFFDDYESTYAEGYSTKYPDFFESHQDGTFTALSYFYSFRKASFLWGDVCDKEPKRVEIIVTAPNFLSKRVAFSFENLRRSKLPNNINTIKLPAISLKRSP